MWDTLWVSVISLVGGNSVARGWLQEEALDFWESQIDPYGGVVFRINRWENLSLGPLFFGQWSEPEVN